MDTDPFQIPTAAELRDGLRGDITKLREQLEQAQKDNAAMYTAKAKSIDERDSYRESFEVMARDNNATFDTINKAIDAAGITFGDDDTYAACIGRLASERDAARADVDLLTLQLAYMATLASERKERGEETTRAWDRERARASVLEAECKAWRDGRIYMSQFHGICTTDGGKGIMETTDRTHALDAGKFRVGT
jgi:hypothetical protein